MSKIAIFASGAGSNAAKILEHFMQSSAHGEVSCVLTNKKNTGVYEVAKQLNCPIYYFSNYTFQEGEEIVAFLQERQVEWIVLAGFLRKISSPILNSYSKKIINLHPSLLPKFGGKGMYGNLVHEAVLDAKETKSGISIHLVNENFDEGELLFQKSCQIEESDHVLSLAKKIQELEHEHYPKIIEKELLKHL